MSSTPKKRKPKKTDRLLARVLEQDHLRRLGAVLVYDDLEIAWMDPIAREPVSASSTTVAPTPNPDITSYEPSAFSMDPTVESAGRCCEVLPWANLKKILPQVRVCWPGDKVKSLIDAGGKLAYACEHLRAVARDQQGENYADCDVLDSLRWAEEAVETLKTHGFDPDRVFCSYTEAIREFRESAAYAVLTKDEADPQAG